MWCWSWMQCFMHAACWTLSQPLLTILGLHLSPPQPSLLRWVCSHAHSSTHHCSGYVAMPTLALFTALGFLSFGPRASLPWLKCCHPQCSIEQWLFLLCVFTLHPQEITNFCLSVKKKKGDKRRFSFFSLKKKCLLLSNCDKWRWCQR